MRERVAERLVPIARERTQQQSQFPSSKQIAALRRPTILTETEAINLENSSIESIKYKKNSRISQFAFSMIRKFADSQIRRSANLQIRKFANSQTRRFADLQIRRYANSQTRRSADPQIRKFTDSQIRKFADPQIRRRAHTQTHSLIRRLTDVMKLENVFG